MFIKQLAGISAQNDLRFEFLDALQGKFVSGTKALFQSIDDSMAQAMVKTVSSEFTSTIHNLP